MSTPTTPQKQLEVSVAQYISGSENQAQDKEIVSNVLKLLSLRVDMYNICLTKYRPKYFVTEISKTLNMKDLKKVERTFDLLSQVMAHFDNKVALFNQVSQKEFLFKINLLLNSKNENVCHQKIVDLVFGWYQQFKANRDMFSAFWSFYANFEKQGFQARSEQQFQTKFSTNQPTFTKTQNSNNSLLDMQDQNMVSANIDFSTIQKKSLQVFSALLNKVIQANKIISNIDHTMMDFPPVIKDKMAQIKMNEGKLNKYLFEQQSKMRINPLFKQQCICLRRSRLYFQGDIQTEKRYTELITRYLPQKFELPEPMLRLQEYCSNNNVSSQLPGLDLLDIDGTESNKVSGKSQLDLMDIMDEGPQTQPNIPQNQVKSFFGNLLNNQQKSIGPNAQQKQQITLSDKPIQNDFKTDFVMILEIIFQDFKGYSDPKPIMEKLTDLSDFNAGNFFKKQ